MVAFRLHILLLLFILPITAQGAETRETNSSAIEEVTFLGIKMVGAKRDKIIDHLWAIGGFTQARSSMKKRGFDRFFSNYRLRDSYFIEFRYTSSKELVSAKRLFRPQSTLYKNRHDAIQTQQVASDIVQQIGQPTRVERKSWGGTPSYNAYIWENDQIKVTVDREGSEVLGNVFVLYEVKTDPYFVAEKER